MINEGRKRDAAANAILGVAFAANAAQSPESLLKSGKVEGPGFQLMSRMMKKRKEADRNLDSPRVSEPARNKRIKSEQKTFESFMTEVEQKCYDEMHEDYKNLPREKMERQYDRKKDKNRDSFWKENPHGIGPRSSRGKSDTNIDKHGNSKQTKRISGELKNNPRFRDRDHENWQRMQSKYKSKKNYNAASEIASKLGY